MRRFLRQLKTLIGARRLQSELAEEIELHRQMEQERLERSGMSPADAAHASRRALGNVTLAREDAREVWIWPSVERLWQDVRYGARTATHQATFTIAAVLTLAIGIGAATTVVSVVEAELWRPLPFPHADRLVVAILANPGPTRSSERLSAPQFVEWRAQSQSFEELAAFSDSARRVLRGRPVPEFVRARTVTANFFLTLGWRSALGRVFTHEDEGAPNVAILSDASWRRYFDGASDVVGRTIVLDAQQYTVVGVMPAGMRLEFIADPDIFLPLGFAPRTAADAQLTPVGRLRGGVSLSTAEADVRVVQARLDAERPPVRKGQTARLESLRAFYVGFNRRPLYFFLGAAGFVLLLSCANVANLLLARALRRQREFAIRTALGGGRAALIRQLLVEGTLLAVPGTLGGILLASWMTDVVTAWAPAAYLSRGAVQVDARVCAVAMAAGGLTAILFGLAPAFFTRLNLTATLAPGSRAFGGSIAQRRARHALVASEVALAFVLVFGAGLCFTSFSRLANQPLGFEPQDRFMLGIVLTGPRYSQSEDLVMFGDRLRETVRGIPGVAATAIATTAPLSNGVPGRFVASGRPRSELAEERYLLRAVTPEYFDAFGIRRVAGRGFTDRDVKGSARVAIINESLARRVFVGEDPVGRELELLPGGAPWVASGTVEIVGVVANSKDVGMNEVDFSGLYLPFAQTPAASFQLVVQSAVAPAQIVDTVRRAVLAADRDLPVLAVTMMTERVDQALKGDRFNLLLIGTFALVAVVLASVAIYAAMSYAVQQRTAEFGLRLALGAQRDRILRLALGSSLGLGLIGTAAGFVLVLVLARAVGDALYLVPREHEGVLYGITTTDPATLALTCAVLLGVATVAGVIPARRAMGVDPAVVLRGE